MSPSLIDSVLRRSSGAFVRAARARGLRWRAARTLEAAALEVSPENPALVLDSRQLFEEAATRAVVGDGGNLELSFSLVDELANTVEKLGLARTSDIPDPFRRVWVSNGSGRRFRGVVLTCGAGQLAVFCPPADLSISEIGAVLRLCYRGFSSAVEYDLQLDDAVRLPGALVLHFKRRSGQGEIGRSSVRYPTNLQGSVRLLDADDSRVAPRSIPCVITDFSAGGVALECPQLLEQGTRIRIDVPLPDEPDEIFTAEALVRWARESTTGVHGVGLAFSQLPKPRIDRLDRFLRLLADGSSSMNQPQSLPTSQPAAAPPRRQAPPVIRESQPASRETSPDFVYQELDPIDSSPEYSYTEDDGPVSEALPGEQDLIKRIFRRFSLAASNVTDHPLICFGTSAERRQRRVAGTGTVHISFKFALSSRGRAQQGCLLIPLPDALSMASGYLMLPPEDVLRNRSLDTPDQFLKEALMQLSELVADVVDYEVRRLSQGHWRARSLGCQGVRAGVRPAFKYRDGTDLLVGRSEFCLAEFDPFELILTLPVQSMDC